MRTFLNVGNLRQHWRDLFVVRPKLGAERVPRQKRHDVLRLSAVRACENLRVSWKHVFTTFSFYCFKNHEPLITWYRATGQHDAIFLEFCKVASTAAQTFQKSRLVDSLSCAALRDFEILKCFLPEQGHFRQCAAIPPRCCGRPERLGLWDRNAASASPSEVLAAEHFLDRHFKSFVLPIRRGEDVGILPEALREAPPARRLSLLGVSGRGWSLRHREIRHHQRHHIAAEGRKAPLEMA